MLKSLRVKDFALIDEISLEFAQGLNVLTGETGAGKSLVVDCLELISGARADAQFVKKGREAAVIEAAFDITGNATAKEVLDGIGSEPGPDGSVVLSRELYPSGKSRARIEGRLVSLGELSEAAGALIDIFGQHEGLKMLKPANQLAAVDSFLAPEKSGLAGEAGDAFDRWIEAEEKLKGLKQKAEDRQARLDFLDYQVKELEEASVRPGEEKELLAEAKVLANSGRILESLERAYSMLYDSGSDDRSAIDLAKAAAAELEAAARLGAGLGSAMEDIGSALESLSAAAEAARRARDSMDLDPQRAAEVESRLADIGRMKRKFRLEADELQGFLEGCRQEAGLLRELEIRTEEARRAALEAATAMLGKMRQLGQARVDAAARLSSAVEAQLKELMMPKARFEARLLERTSANGQEAAGGAYAHRSGLETAEFLFSANVGQDLLPLSRIASGGELSRFMLAFKVAGMRGGDGSPVMVFDEVDQGVGGVSANHVAMKLKQASKAGQTIVVTHLAQIAAAADRHILVTKSDDGEQAHIEASVLDHEDRVRELARMLSGDEGPQAIEHARALLSESHERSPAEKSKEAANKSGNDTFSLFR